MTVGISLILFGEIRAKVLDTVEDDHWLVNSSIFGAGSVSSGGIDALMSHSLCNPQGRLKKKLEGRSQTH